MTVEELRASGRVTLTVAEVAKMLELDERTVRRACNDGQLPCIPVGRRLLIPREKFLLIVSAAA